MIWEPLSSDAGSSTEGSTARSDSPAPSAPPHPQEETEKPPDPELEKRLLGYLSDLSLSLPTDSLSITNELNSVSPKRRDALIILTASCFYALNVFSLILTRSQKQTSVTDASRVCCSNSPLRSSSRSGSPPPPLPPPLPPPRSWYRWTTPNYGP